MLDVLLNVIAKILNEKYQLLGYNAMSVECQPTFRRNISPPSSILKMEAVCSSETSVDTQQTTRGYILEVDTIHNHLCENLKSSKF
jgi:hypothetical protein